MPHRELKFSGYSDVLAEIGRLQGSGYEKSGQWSLGQICDHLAYFMEGELDGFTFKVPFLVKLLFGRLVLRRILSTGKMKSGIRTPQDPLPAPTMPDDAGIARLEKIIGRLEVHQGEMHDSPFFGHLTPAQWKRLNLIHCAHHLGFLQPANPGS
jgi:hypothetical protein